MIKQPSWTYDEGLVYGFLLAAATFDQSNTDNVTFRIKALDAHLIKKLNMSLASVIGVQNIEVVNYSPYLEYIIGRECIPQEVADVLSNDTVSPFLISKDRNQMAGIAKGVHMGFVMRHLPDNKERGENFTYFCSLLSAFL